MFQSLFPLRQSQPGVKNSQWELSFGHFHNHLQQIIFFLWPAANLIDLIYSYLQYNQHGLISKVNYMSLLIRCLNALQTFNSGTFFKHGISLVVESQLAPDHDIQTAPLFWSVRCPRPSIQQAPAETEKEKKKHGYSKWKIHRNNLIKLVKHNSAADHWL